MKRYFLIFKLILSTGYVFSQNYVDILKVTGSTTSNNTFDSSSSKTKINEILADVTIPIKINEKASVIMGVIYESIQTKLFADDHVKSFGSTTLKLGVNKVFNEKWSGTLVALPKIASDYKTISNKNFQLGAVGLLKYKKRENLNFKLGLYYNSELFGPFFVPMLGLYYLSPNKKFETNIMLPLQADANYRLFSFMNIGCNFNGQVRTYHLTDITPSNHSSYVAKSTNELFAYLKFNVTKNISLTTKVGQSFARKYRVYNDNDKVYYGAPLLFVGGNRKQVNSDFSNGMIFQVVLSYRINLDKK